MVKDNKPRKIRLSANPTAEALADLRIGDIVYLDGTVYTAVSYTHLTLPTILLV